MTSVTRERARELRRIIVAASASLDDDTATEAKELYDQWRAGAHYVTGTRLRYGGELWRVLQDHDSQADWTPNAAVSLYAKVLAGQHGTDVGEWVQPDSTNPYMRGDKVTHTGHTWESLVDNNVWEPGAVGTEALWRQVD